MPIAWSFYDWSLSRRDRNGPGNFWFQLFALKCALCRRWCLGCDKHWFCGAHAECLIAEEEASIAQVEQAIARAEGQP